jgi:hypothetical protein
MNKDSLIGSSQATPEYWELIKPNWDEWKSVKTAKLWEAVALALEIDPSNFYFFREHKLDTVFNSRHPPRFTQLLKFAVDNISAGGVLQPACLDLDSPEESEIRLSSFVKWAKSIKVELPPDFPGTTSVALKPNIQIRLCEGERSPLLALIAILANEAKIDTSNPYKAAGLIENLTIGIGSRVAVGTIAGHLKRISSVDAKPLGGRERATLLVLIAALCKELRLDISAPSKAAGLIEGLTMRKGAHIPASAIEDHLGRIPKALEKRSY